jgi:hypothetical protein
MHPKLHPWSFNGASFLSFFSSERISLGGARARADRGAVRRAQGQPQLARQVEMLLERMGSNGDVVGAIIPPEDQDDDAEDGDPPPEAALRAAAGAAAAARSP